MDEVARFSRLVLSVQEAALAPERWNSAVSSIVREVNASDAILFSITLPPSLGGFWASSSIQPLQMEQYAAYYHSKDLWWLALAAEQVTTPGFVFNGEAVVDQTTLRRSEFYADFLRQMDIGRLLCSIVTPHGATTMPAVHMSIFRPMRQKTFSDRQLAFVKRLMPHLQAALRTHYALRTWERRAALDQAALNALDTAVVIVNRGAKVLFANEAAIRVFCSGDGLITDNQVLASSTVRETARLRAFIAGLQDDTIEHLPKLIHRVVRPSARRPYILFGQRLPRETADSAFPVQSAAVIFIRDPESATVIDSEILKRHYGCTPAEILLAGLLVRGLTLEQAAAERGISYETARTQLKTLFLKTDCHRQTDLIKLLVDEKPA